MNRTEMVTWPLTSPFSLTMATLCTRDSGTKRLLRYTNDLQREKAELNLTFITKSCESLDATLAVRSSCESDIYVGRCGHVRTLICWTLPHKCFIHVLNFCGWSQLWKYCNSEISRSMVNSLFNLVLLTFQWDETTGICRRTGLPPKVRGRRRREAEVPYGSQIRTVLAFQISSVCMSGGGRIRAILIRLCIKFPGFPTCSIYGVQEMRCAKNWIGTITVGNWKHYKKGEMGIWFVPKLY